MEDYTYEGVPGFGDTFFIYAFDGDLLTSGVSYNNLRVQINDGDFVLRSWKGVDSLGNIATGIQLRDKLQNQFFSSAISPFTASPSSQLARYMRTGWPVLPEKVYPENGYIGFDLVSALPNTSQVGQLAFFGVRRRRNIQNDPVPSPYRYYEKPFSFPVSFSVPTGWSNKSGGYLVVLPITDYDFELRRIDGIGGTATFATLDYAVPQ